MTAIPQAIVNRVRGEEIYQARLNPASVREIRLLHEAGRTQRSLAAQFGVDHNTVHALVNNITWAVMSNNLMQAIEAARRIAAAYDSAVELATALPSGPLEIAIPQDAVTIARALLALATPGQSATDIARALVEKWYVVSAPVDDRINAIAQAIAAYAAARVAAETERCAKLFDDAAGTTRTTKDALDGSLVDVHERLTKEIRTYEGWAATIRARTAP